MVIGYSLKTRPWDFINATVSEMIVCDVDTISFSKID